MIHATWSPVSEAEYPDYYRQFAAQVAQEGGRSAFFKKLPYVYENKLREKYEKYVTEHYNLNLLEMGALSLCCPREHSYHADSTQQSAGIMVSWCLACVLFIVSLALMMRYWDTNSEDFSLVRNGLILLIPAALCVCFGCVHGPSWASRHTTALYDREAVGSLIFVRVWPLVMTPFTLLFFVLLWLKLSEAVSLSWVLVFAPSFVVCAMLIVGVVLPRNSQHKSFMVDVSQGYLAVDTDNGSWQRRLYNFVPISCVSLQLVLLALKLDASIAVAWWVVLLPCWLLVIVTSVGMLV